MKEQQYELIQVDTITPLDYFAARAMSISVAETQETIPASFWDWIKMLCMQLLHMTFLTVNYKQIEGSKERIAKTSYEIAQAMINERSRLSNAKIDQQ